MKRKLRSLKGFTLTEALVAVAILGLIGLALAAGIPTAVRVYRSVTLNAEANVLCATLSTAIVDELRFAEKITEDGDTVRFRSATFGPDVSFDDTDGQIQIGGQDLLSDKAYTGNLQTKLTKLTYSDGCFHVELQIVQGTETENALATASLDVRPLN